MIGLNYRSGQENMKNRICFQFENDRSAQAAYATLEELGYHPRLMEEEKIQWTFLEIQMVQADLTSALEIMQVHGGVLEY